MTILRRTFVGLLAVGFGNAALLAAPQTTAPTIPQDKLSWFAKSLEFKGVVLKDANWHIWGCAPIQGPDGKTHIFTARWPKNTHHEGWRTHSEIAHYVADTPDGEFKFVDVALKGTGKDTWDQFAAHNPAIHKVGDTYALFYIANDGRKAHPSNQKIGLATSKSLNGPWKRVGKDGLILAPPTDRSYYNYKAGNGVNNPAFLAMPDGRFFLYFKSNDTRKNHKWAPRMGLAIADKLEGPYKQLKEPVTKNNFVIEDGYAFRYGNKIYFLTTDNHGLICNGGGLLWESTDGLNFKNPSNAFNVVAAYFPDRKLPAKAKVFKAAKFERPQVLMLDGKPSYLYMPSGVNLDGGDLSEGHAFKINPKYLPKN